MACITAGLLAALPAGPAWAQTQVKVDYSTGPGKPVQQVEAVFRPAQGVANGQALLILHHGGGYGDNTTQQYAELYASQGFATLELVMFRFRTASMTIDPLMLHGQVMGGLKYLSRVPGVDRRKVSAMGLSMGAFLTIDATSNWFYDHYEAGDLRFDKLIALYPVCWFMSEAMKGQTQDLGIFKGLPATFLQASAEIPLLILAAGKDSYDGLDAGACPAFARGIVNPRQAALTQVVVYPDATHGWDHGRNYSFPLRGQCPGRTSCTNRIVYSPETVALGQQAVLAFLNGQ